jgi:hypothetical protein
MASKALLLLVVLQLAWWVVVSPILWELVRAGAVSIIKFLVMAGSVLFLLTASLALARRSPNALPHFALAAGLSGIGLAPLYLPVAISSTLLAVVGTFIAWRRSRADRGGA